MEKLRSVKCLFEGYRVGKLVCLSEIADSGRKKWSVQCDCGKIVIVMAKTLVAKMPRMQYLNNLVKYRENLKNDT